MASSLTIYNLARKFLMDGTLDLDSNTIKLALVLSTYTPAVTTDEVWADISGSPDHEVLTGDGYTIGGATLTGLSIAELAGVVTFTANDVTWSSLAKTFRYGVLYVDDTVNGIVKPLIACILFDTTPVDVEVSGVDFLVQWHDDGILTLS